MFTLKERKKSAKITVLLRLEPVSFMNTKSRLTWFGVFDMMNIKMILIGYLHNKRRYVCLSVADGWPNGWADQDQTWHRDSC